jgi:formamidopyrimidine-DNA glycosylase
MFELPEFTNMALQMNSVLPGRRISGGSLGNSPHKFVWYNRRPDEFAALVTGRTAGTAAARGRWLFVEIEPGYRLVFGECGGKLLFHPPGSSLPVKYHLHIAFEDGALLSATTAMWGAMELFEAGREQERQYIKGMRPVPLEPAFSWEYFNGLVEELKPGEKRSAKSLLTQDQTIPGLGNSSAQDILFCAGLNPRHAIQQMGTAQVRRLYEAIQSVSAEILAGGGRDDETDLFNQPGRYTRLMSSTTAGKPCPRCATPIEKVQYLGGACYFCPHCQS